MNTDLKLAVAYARVSTKDQERTGHTLPMQAKNMHEYAQNEGLSIVKEYVVAESASKRDRKQYGEMWNFLALQPKIKHIIFDEIDRFTRNDKDKLYLEDKVNYEGYVVHFVTDELKLDKETSAEHIYHFDVSVADAKKYSLRLSRKVKNGQMGKLLEGGYPGSTATYGYQKVNTELIPELSEKPVVLLMFAGADRLHQTLKQIAAGLNKQGFRTRAGKRFSQAFVHRILTDPIYYGQLRWMGKLYPGHHEPFIDRACFGRVHAWLSRKHPNHQIKHTFTYRGFMKCGGCGCMVTAETKKGHVYYHCTGYKPCSQIRYMREEWVEDHILNVLDCLHLGDESASIVEGQILAKRDEADTIKKLRVEDLKQQQERMDEWLDKLYDDKAAGIIDEAMYLRKSKDYANRKEGLVQAMADIDKNGVANTELSLSVLNLANRASEIYKRRLPDEKRQLLNFLLSHAILRDENLDLTLRLPFQYIADYRKSGNWSSRSDRY